jgi:hypothetical protein
MSAIWQNLRLVWARADWSWIVLWIGLAFLIVAFLVLVRTRWGQSQPLSKCALLSLLAHLLLAVYATTIQIVVATSSSGTADGVRISLVDTDDASAADEDPAAIPVAQATDPSAVVSLDPAAPARLDIAPRLSPTFVASSPQSTVREDTTADLQRLAALADNAPALPRQTARSRAPAETIDDAQSPSRSEAGSLVPDVSSPQRMSIAETSAALATDHQTSGVSEKSTAADVVQQLDIAGDVASGTGAESIFRSSSTSSASLARPAATLTADSGGGTGTLLVPVKTTGDPTPPKIYQDRVAEDRAAVARRRGGSAETEAAVEAALAWLAANQSSDGRWDADHFGAGQERSVLGQNRQGAGAHADTATTGLAVLAFLGAGHTHLAGKYKDNVKRGLEHLLNAQAQDGNLGGDAELFAFMYSHGIATLAVSEAYAMTRDKRLEQGVRSAIQFTLAAQHPTTGGWRYRIWSSSPSDAGDTSQLGWQLMALKSAELSGIAIPDGAREGLHRFIKSVSSGSHGGLASYRARERSTRPMTAEALVCRQFLGMSRDNPAANEAGNYLLGELPGSDHVNLYYWYYGTLAMYQLQGDHWQKWNQALQETLLKQQIASGANAGSFDPNCVWAGYGGRVYSTAMAALCLEVYYRYLPLYGDFGPDLREAKRSPGR